MIVAQAAPLQEGVKHVLKHKFEHSVQEYTPQSASVVHSGKLLLRELVEELVVELVLELVEELSVPPSSPLVLPPSPSPPPSPAPQ